MQRAYLRVMSADGPAKLVIGDSPVTIGRHPDNALILTDVQASRFHCVISRTREGGFAIRDLDSRNGTKVNGQVISQCELNRGDVITIGTTELSLVFMGGKAAAPDGRAENGANGLENAGDATGPVRLPPPVPAKAAGRPTPPVKKHPAPPPASAAEEPEILSLDAIALPPRKAQKPAGPPAPQQRGTPPRPAPTPPPAEPSPADDPIDLDAIDLDAVALHVDGEMALPTLAEALPNKQFGVESIELLNARGQTIHPKHEPGKPPANASEVVFLLRQVLLICCRTRATDIHVEPKSEDFQLRLRIDGLMVDIVRLTKATGVKLCALVKILSDIDVQYKNIVQEGHFSSLVPDRRIDYRVSFAPAMFGQKLVVRILDTAGIPMQLGDLKLPLWMAEEIRRVSQADSGMILVCGPTGSGKTTTLYATLRGVGTDHRNVVTIEDPVEVEIPGATQVPVNEERGNTFSALLRSLLRQDPDVLMVGEVRDAETARIAMQAAMTGHLVLSTIHAKDTVGAMFRLLDLGIEPYTVASGLQVIVSQRLARELCPHCKKPVRPTPQQKEKMGSIAEKVQEIYQPAGCPRCLKTGFSGRRAFFELMLVNDELREIILKSPSPKEIESSLRGAKFPRLTENGYQLVIRGITAFEEVEKVVGR